MRYDKPFFDLNRTPKVFTPSRQPFVTPVQLIRLTAFTQRRGNSAANEPS
jgi:hypothetical protein